MTTYVQTVHASSPEHAQALAEFPGGLITIGAKLVREGWNRNEYEVVAVEEGDEPWAAS